MSERLAFGEFSVPVAQFDTGGNVTVKVYDLVAETWEILDDNTAPEIMSGMTGTGYYSWSFAGLHAQPSTEKEFLVMFTDSVSRLSQATKAKWGGFPNTILDAIDNIEITQASAGINASAIGFTLTKGIVISGTYLDVRNLDGVFHIIDDDGLGEMDIEYQFDIGRNAYPSEAVFTADLYNMTDSLYVMAWNWVASLWEIIGIRIGDNDSVPTLNSYKLLQVHVGTGVDVGQVRIRFYNTGLTACRFRIDQLVVSYAVVVRSIGFYGKAVSGTATQIVLGAEASGVNDYYKPGLVNIVSGRGADQYGRISSYDGATKTITIAGFFVVEPDSTSMIQISPWGSVRVSEMETSVAQEIRQEMDANSIQLGVIRTNSDRVDGLIEDDGLGADRFTAKALEEASGTGASAEDVRIEMDANSTKLIGIYADTQRVDGLIEDDGLCADRFTAKALEEAPAGGGGGGGGAPASSSWVAGELTPGGTVTITLYDSNGDSVPLDDTSCEEVDTGFYRWSTVNITTFPDPAQEFLWVMFDGNRRDYGMVTIGVTPDVEALLALIDGKVDDNTALIVSR